MSIGIVKHIMQRIEAATAESAIAVFRVDKTGVLDAVFASTVATRQMIDSGHPDLIGVYHGGMSAGRIEDELNSNVTFAA